MRCEGVASVASVQRNEDHRGEQREGSEQITGKEQSKRVLKINSGKNSYDIKMRVLLLNHHKPL